MLKQQNYTLQKVAKSVIGPFKKISSLKNKTFCHPFVPPHVVPNLYNFLSAAENKCWRKCEMLLVQNNH